jgi:prepilin-type N-terminal cleavage/methylation domain-containing protein
MKNAGFTLVELLVTITIFVILTGVVLFSQSRFNSTIFLTNLAYDTALTIRQAQTFGINIKEFNGAGEFLPYGVHFNIDNPDSFILFADVSYNPDEGDSGTGEFAGDASKCEVDKGCVTRYNITRGNKIGDLCIDANTCGLSRLDIVFIRPNPDAIIRSSRSGSIDSESEGRVVLTAPDGSTRTVRVSRTGLIEIIRQ